MLCCAFAAFILSQIVFAFDSVRERVLGVSPARDWRSGAAAWRPGDATPIAASAAPRARRLALALGLSCLVAGAAYALSLRAPQSSAIHAWHPSIWCSSALDASGE
jgi:hypothetical protein